MPRREPAAFTMRAIRDVVTGFLPGTAIMQSLASTTDSSGYTASTWTPVTGGTVACRFNVLQPPQVETLSAAVGVRVEYSIVVPYNAPYQIGHRVSVGGTAYQIRSTAAEATNTAFIKLLCNRDV